MPNNTQYYEDMELGDEIGPLDKNVTLAGVEAFCRTWGNPPPNRFTDETIAIKDKLPGPIVPGIMSMAMMAQLFTDQSPSWVLKHLDVVFRQMVLHVPVVITAVVTDIRQEDSEYLLECDVHLVNREGDRLVGGKAIVSVPSNSI